MKKWFLIFILIIIFLVAYFLVKEKFMTAKPIENDPTMSNAEIKNWYGDTITIKVNGINLKTSVADTAVERELGLSGTPQLPLGMAKLFVFDHSDTWAFWMKDMNYSIDIVWLDQDKKVIHIEKNLSPATYPKYNYKSETPALYVLELPANYSDILKLDKGNQFIW